MFTLVSDVRQSAAAAQQPVGAGMLNPARLLDPLRPKKCVDAVKPPVEQSAKAALLMKYASERWWAIRATAVQPGTMLPQIDVIATLKVLIALHFPNPSIRENLYRAIMPTNIDSMLDAENEKPEPFEFTQYERVARSELPLVPPDLWIALFEMIHLPKSNINGGAGRLTFKEDYMLADPDTHSKPLPDTSAFVSFLQALIGQMNCGFGALHNVIYNLFHDSVLLYFATLCLMQKNALELLQHPHFDYLNAPLGRSRQEIGPDGHAHQQTFRNAVYTFMHESERAIRLDLVDKDKKDWLERVKPVEFSWVVILAKMCPKRALPQTIVAPAGESAAPPVPERAPSEPSAPAAAPAVAPAAGTVVVPPAASAPPAAPEAVEDVEEPGDEEGPEEDADQPVAGTAPEATAAAAATTTETATAPAATTEPTAATIAARIGPVRTRAASETNTLFAHPLLNLVSAQTGTQRAASVLICASLHRQQPEIARSLCTGPMPSALPRSTSDWYSTLKVLDGASAPSRANLEGVDKLARYAGWAAAPVHERAKRYVAAYCGADIDDLWRANGWKPLSDMEHARVKQFKSVNRQPSVRTTRVLMHLSGTDE